MKVYINRPDNATRGISRVDEAIIKYAPKEIEFTIYKTHADLIVFHVIGRHDKVQKEIERIKRRHQNYVMIQYCLVSTQKPDPKDWLPLWNDAQLVWSYYDLNYLCLQADIDYWNFNFYHAPLGADADIFKETKQKRIYKVITSSQHALSEGVRECAFAVKRLKKKMLHIGHELRRGEDIVCKSFITDEELAKLYSQSEFVCGLRRIEGFELPVIEGLLCGARPIVYDKPHYRQWFDGLAVFIPETPREEVINSLEKVFKKGARPITEKEKEIVRKRFNWEKIIKGFWERILI